MEKAKQLSVQLENKPGRLANVLAALDKEKINLTGLSVMDSHEHSVLRFVCSDPAKATAVLKAMNIPHAETEVLLVEFRNQPGAVLHVCEMFAEEHINIDYCYVSAGGRNGKTLGIFKLSNVEKAMKLLNQTNNKPDRQMGRRPMFTRR